MEDYAATWDSWEVTVGVIIHDRMSDLRQNGAGGRHLRRELWTIFGKIFHQERIKGPKSGGTVEFKLERCYKTHSAS